MVPKRGVRSSPLVARQGFPTVIQKFLAETLKDRIDDNQRSQVFCVGQRNIQLRTLKFGE